MRTVVFACLAATGAAVARADVTYTDGTFPSTGWGFETVIIGSASGTAVQRTTGGNPGEARRVSNTVNSATGGAVWSFSRFGTTLDTRYVAGLQGAIASIDFSIDFRVVSGTLQNQGIMVGLKQGQVVYVAGPGATIPGGAWGAHAAAGLTAADFHPVPGGAGSPDFSVNGDPIRFGFIAMNSSVGGAFTMNVDYDNYFLRVVAVPAPGALALGAIGLLGAARRRR